MLIYHFFLNKVPEEINYKKVSINDAAVKSLNTLKINIPEAVSVLALSDGFCLKFILRKYHILKQVVTNSANWLLQK